ncbi:MAG: polysaccharide deacetylase family protein [Terracidiphilus sp.]
MMLTSMATGVTVALGAAATVGLSAGGLAYAALWPGSQIFGPTITAPHRPFELALTFDDGPNPAWTPQLLDLLDSYETPATFFLIGRFAQAEPQLVRRILAAGHLIGNHSWSHPNLAITPTHLVRQELQQTSETLEQTTGLPVRWFRPPFGARRPAVLEIARSLGMTPVLWNAITSDWSEPSGDRIASRLMGKIDRHDRKGWATNIVLHDGGHLALGANRGPSVQAVEQLLARYKPTHRFVPIDAWSDDTARLD